MTMFDSGVRGDSLELLDVWLERMPLLVAQHQAVLVPNLLMMITTSVAVDPSAAAARSNTAGKF